MKKTRASQLAPAAAKGSAGTYRSISIVAGSQACAAAQALAGKRILAARAPLLPLSDCSDPANCRCRFEKHQDRREGEEGRRLSDVTATGRWEQVAWYAGPEKRKRSGRRKDD